MTGPLFIAKQVEMFLQREGPKSRYNGEAEAIMATVWSRADAVGGIQLSQLEDLLFEHDRIEFERIALTDQSYLGAAKHFLMHSRLPGG